MKRTLLFFLMFVSSVSFAEDPPQPTADGLDADQLNQIAAQLATEVSPGYRELKRDIYLFNHEHPETFLPGETNPVPPDSDIGIQGVKRQILWTYRRDKPSTMNMMGQGLYAAPDPQGSSESYGEAVVQIKLPAKMRYIQANSIPFSAEFQIKLAAAGCTTTDLRGMFQSPNKENCHIIATRMLEILHISAVQYKWGEDNWPNGLPKYPGCDPLTDSAFIIVNPAIASTEYLRILHKGQIPADSASQDRSMIQALSHTDSLTGDFPGAAPPTADVKAWTKEHILGCDHSKYPEDIMLDSDPNTVIHPPAKAKLPPLDFKTYDPTWNTPDPPLQISEPCQDSDATSALRKVEKMFLSLAPILERVL
jgi:hypothetical protein